MEGFRPGILGLVLQAIISSAHTACTKTKKMKDILAREMSTSHHSIYSGAL